MTGPPDEPVEDLSGAVPAPDPQPDAPHPDIDPGSDGTVPWRALLAEAAATLAARGVENAEGDARRIVEEATGHDGAALHAHLDEPATVRGVAALDRMVERRLAGEPLQYVLGRWGFRTLDLMVDDRVLIPRPETEGVVDHVLAELRQRRDAAADTSAVAPVVVDLGCGSGAIGLAVAAEWRGAEVHLVDVSAAAVAVARANLAGLGIGGGNVTVHEGSWFAPLPPDRAGRVDVVVSNPPYVAADEELPPVVADWEPTGALVSGPTGLEAVEAIVAEAGDWLVPGGLLVVEIGATQGEAAAALAAAARLVDVEVRPDLAGRDRALVARTPPAP
ncbi:MAG TPA: peptide chain release factor N(5)-glutamine methyltransferase [Iamia sp.]|nr:peptide chain release factor N(5)-glutamine methyltransferase [Iamia sp.]